jgi:hypothetical protein
MHETVSHVVSFVPRLALPSCATVSLAWYYAAMRPPRWRHAAQDPNDDPDDHTDNTDNTDNTGREIAAAAPRGGGNDDHHPSLDRRQLDEARYRNAPALRFRDANRRSLVTRFQWRVRGWARKSNPDQPPVKAHSPVFTIGNQADFSLICYPMGAHGQEPQNRGIALYLEGLPRGTLFVVVVVAGCVCVCCCCCCWWWWWWWLTIYIHKNSG